MRTPFIAVFKAYISKLNFIFILTKAALPLRQSIKNQTCSTNHLFTLLRVFYYSHFLHVSMIKSPMILIGICTNLQKKQQDTPGSKIVMLPYQEVLEVVTLPLF